jgi:thioesterase domain-containing protein
VEISLAELLCDPTARGLAQRLTDDTASVTTPLLCWRRGDREMVVCLHGWMRELLSYRALLPHLPDDVGVYAVAVQGLDSAEPLLTSVTAMALRVVALVLPECGTRPVRLVGHSFGGLVAQETARLLSQQGVTVASLVLLDSVCYAASTPARRAPFARGPESSWLRRCDKTLRGVVWTGLHRSGAVLGVRRKNQMRLLNRANHFAGRLFVASLWPGRATLVVTPGSQADAGGDPALGWTGAFDAVDIHRANTGHWSLLDAAHGRYVADLVLAESTDNATVART